MQVDPQSNPFATNRGQNQGVAHQDKNEQEDFDTICQFFAGGGGNDSDDEKVWMNLTNYVRECCVIHSLAIAH
jgi:hypothetical protein